MWRDTDQSVGCFRLHSTAKTWKEEKKDSLLNYDYRGIEIEDYVMKK